MFNIKKTAFLVSFAFFSAGLVSPASSGDLRGELNSMFMDMQNYTQPGVFESTRRGVISGGGFSGRSRTMTIQLASFEPPNIKAGCGGIDIFMGSFSYINKDQFISFLRAIAANAAGYAFQMALGVSCNICKTVIDGMQNVAQMMNNANMNSCQLAHGLIDGGRAAAEGKLDAKASLESVWDGLVKDFTDDKSNATQGRETAWDKNPDKFTKEYLGNIVWQAMISKSVNDWFGLRPGDTSMMEVLMSISGTVVKEKPINGEKGKVFPTKIYPGDLVTLRDLVEGSERDRNGTPNSQSLIYSCANDKNDCMNPQRTRALNIPGLAKQIEEALNKPDGIIHKFANDRDGSLKWTQQEKALISNFPVGVGTAIHNLAMGSEDAAKSLTHPASKVIALTMTHSLMVELIKAIEASLTGLPEDKYSEVQDLVDKAKERLDMELRELLQEYGNVHSILIQAKALQELMQYEHPFISKNPVATGRGSGSTE